MTISLSSLTQYINNMSIQTWGLTVIGAELYVGKYNDGSVIYVYDLKTGMEVRNFDSPVTSNGGSIGTDGVNLLIKDGAYQIATLNKLTGTLISTKTNYNFVDMTFGASFYVDTKNDLIFYPTYGATNNVVVKNFSSGTVVSTYTVGGKAVGVTLVEDDIGKYIFVSSYSDKRIYVSNVITTNNFTGLTFTLLKTHTTNIVGLSYYNKKLYLSTYDGNGVLSVDINGLVYKQSKILIKKSDGVYLYCDVNDGTFKPLGHEPTDEDYLNFGVDTLTQAHIEQLALQGIKGRQRIRRL